MTPYYSCNETQAGKFLVLFNGSVEPCDFDSDCSGEYAVCGRLWPVDFLVFTNSCFCAPQLALTGPQCASFSSWNYGLITVDAISVLISGSAVLLALRTIHRLHSKRKWLRCTSLNVTLFVALLCSFFLMLNAACLISSFVATPRLNEAFLPLDETNGNLTLGWRKQFGCSGPASVTFTVAAFLLGSFAILNCSLIWIETTRRVNPNLISKFFLNGVYRACLIAYFVIFSVLSIVFLANADLVATSFVVIPALVFVAASYVWGGLKMRSVLQESIRQQAERHRRQLKEEEGLPVETGTPATTTATTTMRLPPASPGAGGSISDHPRRPPDPVLTFSARTEEGSTNSSSTGLLSPGVRSSRLGVEALFSSSLIRASRSTLGISAHPSTIVEIRLRHLQRTLRLIVLSSISMALAAVGMICTIAYFGAMGGIYGNTPMSALPLVSVSLFWLLSSVASAIVTVYVHAVVRSNETFEKEYEVHRTTAEAAMIELNNATTADLGVTASREEGMSPGGGGARASPPVPSQRPGDSGTVVVI